MSIIVNDFLREYELMGWIVETRWSPYSWEIHPNFPNFTSWENQWNHKLYATEEIAKDAMKQHNGMMRKQEYRYRPVYSKKINE